MNDLKKYFLENKRNLIHKWDHYFEIYDRHFKRFRNKEINLLEIGISQGGSLQMWKNYFGDKANIFGVDIDPRCKSFEEDNIKIFIGSQTDKVFLNDLKTKIPKLDILIDDGGHTMRQQIITFQCLFHHIRNNGVYLCEDLHTSYWLRWGGGYRRRGTFIEYTKHWIDSLNAYHSQQKNFHKTKFTKSVDSIHYYDSVIILEKRNREKPNLVSTGYKSLVDEDIKIKSRFSKIRIYMYIYKKNFLIALLTLINKVLRYLRLPSLIWK